MVRPTKCSVKSIGATYGVIRRQLLAADLQCTTLKECAKASGLLHQLKVRTLLDLPCGDFHWLSKIDLPVEHYIGADIVPELVARTNSLHSRPDRTFLQIDLCNDPLPAADLLLCRDCFVHLSEDMIDLAINNILRSNIRYLLTTTFPAGRNRPIRTGDFFSINLCAPPYNFPPPIKVLDDYVPSYEPHQLALWEVESLHNIRRDPPAYAGGPR